MSKACEMSSFSVSPQIFAQNSQSLLLSLLLGLVHMCVDLAEILVGFLRDLSRQFVRDDISHQDISSECSKLSKFPRHVAFCVAEKAEISYPDLAKLASWCIVADIQNITFYDTHGILKRNQKEFLSQIRNYFEKKFPVKLPHLFQIEWHGHQYGNVVNGNGIHNNRNGSILGHKAHISLVSLEDGKADIVKTARILAAKPSSEIDENQISQTLSTNKGAPDPDILIRLGPAESTLGFLPWQLRLTEFHRIQSHKNVIFGDLLQVFRSYAKCNQRFGQ